MKTMTDPAVPGHAAGRRTAGPAVAGLVYVAAWVVGFVVGPASLDVTAPDTAVVSAYAGSQGAAIAQVVLTEGVAAVALAVLVLALGRTARGRGDRRIARRIEVPGLAAVVLSLVQCAYGVRLVGWVAPGGDSSLADSLFQFISRIDGVKMFLLAVLAVSGMTLARRAGALPPRVAFSGAVLTAALAGGGLRPWLPAAEPGAGPAGIPVTAALADLGGRHGRVAVPGSGSQPGKRRSAPGKPGTR